MQESASPKSIRFLTLTLQSQSDLGYMVRLLQRCFRKLRQRPAWKKRVTGGAFVIEFTHNDSGWHAHIHALIAGDYFPFALLLDEWQAVSKGRGVYIKQIPAGRAVSYVTKYITKADEKLSDDDITLINRALFGIRLYQPFGEWHGWNISLKLEHPPCPDCESTRGYYCVWDLKELSYALDNLSDAQPNAPPVIQQSLDLPLVTFIDPF